MTPAKDLPMVMEKTSEEIENIIELVMTSSLPESVKPFVIGCINLATWLPKGLMEHKITVTNLKRLIFGKGDKKQKIADKSKRPNEGAEPSKDKTSDTATIEDLKN